MILKSYSLIKIKLLLYILVISTSCRNNNTNINTTKTNVIIGKVAKLEESLSTREIHIIDSLIIIQEYGNTYNFIVYNKNSLEPVGKFGREGRGPSEYNLPMMMKQKITLRDSVYLIVYDLNLKRIDSINILNSINKTNYYPRSLNFTNRKLSQVFPFETAVIAADSFLVGTCNYNDGGKFFCYDIFNNSLEWEPYYPTPKIKPAKQVQGDLYKCYLALRPNKEEIAAVSLFFERIDILNKKGELKRSIVFENQDKGPDFSSPDRMPPKGVHEYFTSVSVTQDFIYALNIDLDTDNNTILDTVSLIKSSWEDKGIPPETYKLTPRVMKMAVDEENRKIYGIQLFGSDIYIYDLK
jgi:hypothetical protein